MQPKIYRIMKQMIILLGKKERINLIVCLRFEHTLSINFIVTAFGLDTQHSIKVCIIHVQLGRQILRIQLRSLFKRSYITYNFLFFHLFVNIKFECVTESI